MREIICAEKDDRDPTFTIVIPTYRRPGLAWRAVSSALAQQHPALEVIVVDDGSGSSWDYSAVEELPTVIMVRKSSNGGAASARNCGIRLARGRYVCFLDDDDELAPNFLSEMARAIRGQPVAPDLLWCGVQFIQYSGGFVTARKTTRVFPSEYSSIEALQGDALSIGTGYGFTASRQLLVKVGLFDEDLRVTEDTELIVRLIEAGATVTAVSQVLVSVHDHEAERLTGAHFNRKRVQECSYLLQRHSAFFDMNPPFKLQLQLHIQHLRENFISQALSV